VLDPLARAEAAVIGGADVPTSVATAVREIQERVG
jgi:hypothetical protein